MSVFGNRVKLNSTGQTFQVDLTEFNKAKDELLKRTTRSVADWCNARMFYLLLRLYSILPPKDVQAKRNEIRAQMNAVKPDQKLRRTKKNGKPGRKIAKNKLLQAKHLILNSIRGKEGKKGLYGRLMYQEAGVFARGRSTSAGYLKSGVVRALRELMKMQKKTFTQFGGMSKKHDGRGIRANTALVKMAKEYGVAPNNVSIFRGNRCTVYPAKDGISPETVMQLSIGVADDQLGKVENIYQAAMKQAYADETLDMKRHLEEKIKEEGEQVTKR